MMKVRNLCKEVSILISWSLEAAIETSDSMEARGYGLKGRTSFHLFKMTRRDAVLLAGICVTGITTACACFMGYTDIYYYPEIRVGEFNLFKGIALVMYVVLLGLPLFIDITGERKWQR